MHIWEANKKKYDTMFSGKTAPGEGAVEYKNVLSL